jgi:3-oxoacyl-(acyl-carrier-protein) synthase
MPQPRLVITGCGAVGAFGVGADSLWSAALGARPAARRVPGLLAARIPVCPVDIDLPTLGLVHGEHRLDRAVRLALLSSSEAARHAQLREHPIDPTRVATIVGTSRGPVSSTESAALLHRAGERVPPSLAVSATTASLSGALSIAHGARGPAMTISAACAASGVAIATAASLILAGDCDAAIVGGAEALLTPAVLSALEAAGVLGDNEDPSLACRPFDRRRNGTVMGEGAAFLVLETESSARARGVPALARLAGWSAASDAANRAAEEKGAAALLRAMQAACARADLNPRDLGYINAHGTGTAMNDLNEALAVRSLVGGGEPILCSSTKPVTGHCAGATSAMEAIVTIEALRRGIAPPTAACEEPDPRCPIDPVAVRARTAPITAAMSNSLGFWGSVASLLFLPA